MSDRDFYRAIPEPGQLVEVRGRRFSVADIRISLVWISASSTAI